MVVPRARTGLLTPFLTLLAVAALTAAPVRAAAPEPGGPAPGPVRAGDTEPPLPVVDGAIPPADRPTTATGDAVALRPLVIALDATDPGLPTWRAVLDRVGTPYDVLPAMTEPLTAGRLVRPDGTGRYDAVLLTTNALLHPDGAGGYASALDAAEWQALWAYERAYAVRQVSLYTSWGTFPEDYCLRPGVEGAVTSPVRLSLADAGAELFDRLRPTARVPLHRSYAYRSALAGGCAARPLLTLGDHVLGVVGTSVDGRERAALAFSSREDQAQTDVLGYGLLRWATRGVLVGESRHWLTVDVDDWFNTGDHLHEDGRLETEPGFRLSGEDAAGAVAQQRRLREDHPVAGDFTLTLAYNGGGLDPGAPARCSSADTGDPLTGYSRCLAGEFRWLNHTVHHPPLDSTTYAENAAEIADNLAIARRAGLTVPTEVLKTPAYSGLGVYHPDPGAAPTDPPTDFGLTGSNRALLAAARDLGVRYLHGNMSFAGHRPGCFNCGTRHPLEPSLLVVPDWPTDIAYHVTTPAEQTYFHNHRGGRPPSPDLTYDEIVDHESDVALRHVLTGSAYAHTLHQGNLREYSPGRSLVFDWLRAVVGKYAEDYRVPLRNPDWPALARYADARTAHFAELRSGGDAVWDRHAGTVAYTPATTGSLFFTGVTARDGEVDAYGADTVSRVPITAGVALVATAAPRA
ncbi:Agd3-related carbohydrate-binding protein [Saccharothrix syringae]|uniref:Agd3-related carbohydrate-binding protein n=1 Tax=Saccharothrix syringae TaxID=103733 RepID=UPI000B0F53A4|nr:hypothetical protein [Saccharothrix syringae]